MTATPSQRPAVEVRPANSGRPLPPGWAADQVRWAGVDHEVAYDPTLTRVVHVAAGYAAAREALAAHGWERVDVDTAGGELWAIDRGRRAQARLDHLTATPPAPAANDLAVGT